jgi:hypothetical protein
MESDKKRTSDITTRILSIIAVLIIFAFKLFLNPISEVEWSIVIVAIIIILICLASLTKKRPLKILMYFLSTYTFIQFLIVPLVISLMLDHDQSCFEINNVVVKNETIFSQNKLEDNFKPIKLSRERVAVMSLANSPSKLIDTSLSYLNTNNLLLVDSFYLAKTIYPVPASRPSYMLGVRVFDFNGDYLFDIPTEADINNFKSNDSSIRSLLKGWNVNSESRVITYNKNFKEISEGKIWSFTKLIPYVFTFKNIKPISRWAEFVFGISQLLTNGLLFSTIVAIVRDLLLKKG